MLRCNIDFCLAVVFLTRVIKFNPEPFLT